MRKVTVTEAESMIRDDLDAMRKEYTKMRDIAQKRIKRMEQSVYRDTQAVKSHTYTSWKYKINEETGKKEKVVFTQHGFQELKNFATLGDFAKAYSELSKFVNSKGSTITGQRQIKEKIIKTWQDQGLGINNANYDKVIKILEEMRKQKIVYGSDKAVELADAMLYLDDQQIDNWLDNLSTLLEHSDEVKEMTEDGFIPVDMDDFIREAGW